MDTSCQQIHISIDAIVNDEGKVNKVNIALDEEKISIDTNKQHQDANEKGSTKKQEDDKQEQKSISEQKVEENNQNHKEAEITRDIFIFDDGTEEVPSPESVCKTKIYDFVAKAPSITKSSKDNLVGGGQKPISQKQKSLIIKMADERNEDINDVVSRVCNKTFNELKGQDADKIIKSMTKKRR